MSPVRDPQTLIRHTVFRADPAQGALRQSEAGRAAVLTRDTLHAFHAVLVERCHDATADVLYRCGYEWGLQEMVLRHQRLRDELGGASFDLWQMDAKFVLGAWWSTFAEAGWGQTQFDCFLGRRNLFVAHVRGSIVASSLHPAEEPVCHLHAGLFAGAVSFFERTECHAAEIACAAVDADVCRFVVASGPEIDSAESWRQQGIAPDEIVRRLR